MDWFKNLHPSERADRALEAILERTGVGAQIQKELDADRATTFENLRLRKVESVTRLQKAAAPANAAVATFEEKEKQARKDADDALKAYQKAREQLSTIYETHRNECADLDVQMLTCYDPAIDTFIVELEQLLAKNHTQYRAWLDPKGPLEDTQKRRMSDNHAAIDRRATAIFHLKHDIVPTLRTAQHITNLSAEIDRLRASIPEA